MTDTKTIEPLHLPFERITSAGCPPSRFFRARVPRGWVLLDGDTGAICHVDDPEHEWVAIKPHTIVTTAEHELRSYDPHAPEEH